MGYVVCKIEKKGNCKMDQGSYLADSSCHREGAGEAPVGALAPLDA